MDANTIPTDSRRCHASGRIDELTERLDRLETELPTIPSRAIHLTRATVHRITSTAMGVADDVGRQLGRLSSTTEDAVATTTGQARSAVSRTAETGRRTTKQTVGQARSAVERTAETGRRTAKETTGQARAQAKRTLSEAQYGATALLDDAARAVEPDGDGMPASLDAWTKADLYERAQELDIDGRSSMSKQQLVRAIHSAT